MLALLVPLLGHVPTYGGAVENCFTPPHDHDISQVIYLKEAEDSRSIAALTEVVRSIFSRMRCSMWMRSSAMKSIKALTASTSAAGAA